MAQDNPWSGFQGFEQGRLGAKNAALSGSNGAIFEGDISDGLVNPAGFSADSRSDVILHSVFFPAGIRSFSLQGLISRDSLWAVAAGLIHTGYGENKRFDIEGNETGVFPASISGAGVSVSRLLADDWRMGLGMNYDWRRIDIYQSHLLRFDVGVIYERNDRTSFGMSLSNLGYELVPFDTERDRMPLDLSLYWQQKLAHLPFTFFLRMQKMNLWNRMVFDQALDESDDILGGNEQPPSRITSLIRETMRHLVLGGEFGFGEPEKVWLRFSYDHWKNQQLSIPAIRSLDGVALGFGVKLAAFRLDYTWEKMYYNAGGHQLSLSFRLGEKDRRERGF